MNIDRSMKFAVALLMLISGFTALISEGIGEVDAAEAVYYHNSFIHFNVNLHNGTPAVGYYAYWVCRFEYTSVSKLVDAQGDATLNLTFNKLGHGIIRVRDPSHKLCYDEETFIGMDETLYRNITLPPPSEPYNLITGTLKYADTQLPVPGEKITISATDDIGEGLVAYLSTNSEGRYEAYLPNITKNPVYVSCSSINGYRSVARSLYLKEGIHTYTVDLEANIWMKGDLDSRLRFIDAGNGEPLSGALVMESTAADSVLSYYDTMIKTRGPDGWYNFSGSRGELKIYYYMTDFHGWNGFNIITQVLHNDTAMDIEILADPSFLVPVRIDVWNGTHPLSGARARASLEGAGDFGQFSCYYDNKTDMNGTMTAYLPYGRKISFQVSAPDHVTLTAYVDTRGSGPYGANLTLVPVVDPVPSTTSVSVTLVDDETDMIVPDGKVYLYMRYNDHNYGFSGTTDANGKYTATVNVGTYYSIIGVCNLGTGTLTDHVITETGPNDITIRMERYSYPPTIWADDHHFIVRDLDGEAVPGATVRVQSYFNSRSWTSYEFVSDPLGRVDIKAVPGMEVTISTDMVTESGSLNPWAMQRTVIVPQAGVPDMGGVTLYPRPAHSEITGFIRDAGTLEPIIFEDFRAHSVKPLPSEPSRAMMIEDHYMDGVDYMDLYRMSVGDGYFRTYGLETVIFEVDREGYYLFHEEFQVEQSRSGIVHDLLLESLPESRAWLNGTLVNEDGDPIPGELNITDIDHPGMAGYDLIIDGTGAFSIELWPSTYRLRFFNETLTGTKDVVLGEDGIEGLELMLIPMSEISGKALDWEASPIEGLNVTLVLEPEETLHSWDITDVSGEFSFMVPPGTYSIVIEMTDLYSDYRVNDITMDGWSDWYSALYIGNRTVGDVSGTVLGSSGPYTSGIPGAMVSLLNGEVEVYSGTADGSGHFEMTNVGFRTYTLKAYPPANLMPVENIRSGYLAFTIENFTVNGPMAIIDPILSYVEYTPPGFVNITYVSPNGTDVYLDELIVVSFSRVMNKTAVESSLLFSPTISGLSFHWDEWGSVLTIEHDDLSSNTTYTVTIGLGAFSYEGWPLWGNTPYSWDFTTGSDIDPWSITTAEVILTEMNLSVEVTAPTGLSIYICISEIGYFEMTEESEGVYELLLDETHFEYDTVYAYYFTDRFNGDDKAPSLSGTFTTPAAPVIIPEWELYNATVTVLVAGDWKVRADGSVGISVYIVIEGVGSFELQEGAPGVYAVNILSEEFEKGETYSYHFSDREGGPDLAPQFAGTAKDPRGDTTVEEDTPWALICTITIVIILVIVGIVIAAVVLAARRKGDEDLDEE